MDRLTDADPDGRITYWRQALHDGAAVNGEDDSFQDRIDVNGNVTTDPSGIMIDRKDR